MTTVKTATSLPINLLLPYHFFNHRSTYFRLLIMGFISIFPGFLLAQNQSDFLEITISTSGQSFPVADLDHIWVRDSEGNVYEIAGEEPYEYSGPGEVIDRGNAIGKLVLGRFGEGNRSDEVIYRVYACINGPVSVKIRYSKDGSSGVPIFIKVGNASNFFLPIDQNPNPRPEDQGKGWDRFADSGWLDLNLSCTINANINNIPENISAQGAQGVNYQFGVELSSDCSCADWDVVSAPNWVHFTVSGQQNSPADFLGTIYRIDANTSGTSRTGDIVIDLKGARGLPARFRITQEASCGFFVKNVDLPELVPPVGGFYKVKVELSGDCRKNWSIKNIPDWVRPSHFGGNDDREVFLTILPNKQACPREEYIVFEAENESSTYRFLIKQEEATCRLIVNTNSIPKQVRAPGASYPLSISINGDGFCEKNWIAKDLPDWIEIIFDDKVAPSKGWIGIKSNVNSSDGQLNPAREATFSIETIDGCLKQEITINQKAECEASISSNIEKLVPHEGDNYKIKVDFAGECNGINLTFKSLFDWIEIVESDGQEAEIKVHPNLGDELRFGLIIARHPGGEVATIPLFISQLGTPVVRPELQICSRLLPPVIPHDPGSTTYEFEVKLSQPTEQGWEIIEYPNWISYINPKKGLSDATIKMRLSSNYTGQSRTGKIIIRAPEAVEPTKTLSITQLSGEIGSSIIFYTEGQQFGVADLDHFWIAHGPCQESIYYSRTCQDPSASTVGKKITRTNALDSLVWGQFGTQEVGKLYPSKEGEVRYNQIPGKGEKYIKIRYSKNTVSTTPILIFINGKKVAEFMPENQGDPFDSKVDGWNKFTETHWIKIKFDDGIAAPFSCNDKSPVILPPVAIKPLKRPGSDTNLKEQQVISVDEMRMPVEYQYNSLDGVRGPLNVGFIDYRFNKDSYTISLKPGTGTNLSYGGWYQNLKGNPSSGLYENFDRVFEPQISEKYQGEIDSVMVVLSKVESLSNNPNLNLKVEFKDPDGMLIQTLNWKNIGSFESPRRFAKSVKDLDYKKVSQMVVLIENLTIGDDIEIDNIRLSAGLPPVKDERLQAFLWSYNTLLAQWNASHTILNDKAHDPLQSFEGVTATAKFAKLSYFASQLGLIGRREAEHIITSIADIFIDSLPRNFEGLLPHFTQERGAKIASQTEWSTVDTFCSLLDLIVALEMIADPNKQIPELINMLESMEWPALVNSDNKIIHGFDYEGRPLMAAWGDFGGETFTALWAYAAATCRTAFMDTPPSFGSGFIMNMRCPNLFNGLDHLGNKWKDIRRMEAEMQIEWYKKFNTSNRYLLNSNLFGLSAAETPMGNQYIAYRIKGFADSEDGDGEVIIPHLHAMISDIRLKEATRMWQVLNGTKSDIVTDQNDIILFSPWNMVESMRINKENGFIKANYLKSTWNLALMAEGWALAFKENDAVLKKAIASNTFLQTGMKKLKWKSIKVEGPLVKSTSVFPNPFSELLNINYTLQASEKVSVEVYNMLGQKVKNLFTGFKRPGDHQIQWDGSNHSGDRLQSGNYIILLQSETQLDHTVIKFIR